MAKIRTFFENSDIYKEKSVIMDANNQSVMVEGANPDMLWMQHIDYLATQSNIMKKEYIRRKRANKPFTWNDLDVMNKKIHHDLDVVMSGVENVQENKQYNNMNKKLIRLTESDLHRIVKESVNRVIKESDGGIDPSQIDFGLDSAKFDPRYKGVIRAVRNLVNELEAVGADSDLIERANSIEWGFVDSYGNNGITNDMLR